MNAVKRIALRVYDTLANILTFVLVIVLIVIGCSWFWRFML